MKAPGYKEFVNAVAAFGMISMAGFGRINPDQCRRLFNAKAPRCKGAGVSEFMVQPLNVAD
jgi:hypothetical protein